MGAVLRVDVHTRRGADNISAAQVKRYGGIVEW